MAAKTAEKTNALRLLEQKKIPYTEHAHGLPAEMSGAEIAEAMGQPAERVFKTLVAQSPKTGRYYVFMVPVACELDLKKAARAAGEKSIAMIKAKELLPLTGYVHGGCSPIGMKKTFPTFIHQTAGQYPTVFCSGGRVGLQIELPLSELQKLVRIEPADLIREEE
ncbi:MAG: Cys-tRNA(Pro) deacylase [Ruminococcus sp.]|nr:Cys-tRNA(Pro) deacylase [Ruminococcus sp.]